MRKAFREWSKRALAALLAVAMALGTVPASAIADELDQLANDVAVEVQATTTLEQGATYKSGDSVKIEEQAIVISSFGRTSLSFKDISQGTYKLEYKASDSTQIAGTPVVIHTFQIGSSEFGAIETNGAAVEPDAIYAIRNGNSGGKSVYSFFARRTNDGKKEVTISGIGANDKVYDGNKETTLDYSSVTVTGADPEDDVQLDTEFTNELGARFEDENVGEKKTVWFSPAYLTGKDAYKYKVDLMGSQRTTTANITARPINVVAYDDEATEGKDMPSPAKVSDKAYLEAASDDYPLLGLHDLADVTLTYVPNSTDSPTIEGKITPSAAKITFGENDVTSNYNITYVDGSFVVNAVPTVTVTGKDGLVYNADDQNLIDEATTNHGTLQYWVTTDPNATPDKNTNWSALSNGFNAGDYYVWWKVPKGHGWDELVAEEPVKVTIAPKALTFSDVAAFDREYDGTRTAVIKSTDGTTDYTTELAKIPLDGFEGNDDIDYISLNAKSNPTAEFENHNAAKDKEVVFSNFKLVSSNPDDYPVSNYELKVPSGDTSLKATVTKRDVFVTGLKGKNKVYDATTTAEVEKDDTFAIGRLVMNDDIDVDLEKTVANFKQANVGNDIDITFTPALKGTDIDNYNLVVNKSQTTAKANITARPIIVKGADYEADYNGPMPDVDSMEASERASLEAGKENDKTYDVLEGTAIDVVDITFDPANTEHIHKREGQGQPGPADAIPSNVTIVDAKGEDVTTNYNVTYEAGDFVVKRRNSADVQGIEGLVYNGTAQELVEVVEEPKSGTIKYWCSTDPNADPGKVTNVSGDSAWSGEVSTGTDAGDYYVWWGVEETDNYFEIVSDEGIKVTIAPKVVGLSWSGTSLTYNAEQQGPKAKATGVVAGDSVSVTVAGAKTAAGTYTATATALSDSNYVLPASPTASFTIAKAKLTVTARDKAVKYGAAPANAGVTYSGLKGADTAKSLGGTLKYGYGGYRKGSKAGTYKITPSGLSSKNYAITYRKGTLTVKAPATVATTGQVRADGKGWIRSGANGVFGTTGQSRRTTGIRIALGSLPYAGGIEYRGHFETSGWQKAWTKGNGVCAVGDKRLEAVQIRLTGAMAKSYDVYYRVHTQKLGWMAWTSNGKSAGTTTQSDRLEAVQVVVQLKGGSAPAKNYKGIKQTYPKPFTTKV